jgi:DNA invertase Pin-like site-specific DNA recombinase
MRNSRRLKYLYLSESGAKVRGMKALAYIRFSSDDQADGSSIERQEGNIKRYAERLGLTIVETLIDDGFSASKGYHISRGKFGKVFLDHLPKYKGYALIVEEMDRLDRRGIKKTRKLVDQITEAGIEVHVTQTGRVIRDTEDLITDILNSLESHGAAEYSRKLRERVGKAWQTKKVALATTGELLTRNLPFWLDVDDGKIVKRKDQVAIVKRVFELAASGLGSRKIRDVMNGAKLTPSWINKVLASRTVLGEFRPHRYDNGKRVPDGEILFDYYPRIVSDELWRYARTEVDRRSRNDKGRVYPLGGARNSDKADNLFSGLLYDQRERPMWYQKKSGNTNGFLVSAGNMGKPYYRIRCDRFEAVALDFFGSTELVDWDVVVKSGNDPELTAKELRLAELTDAAATNESMIRTADEALDRMLRKASNPKAIEILLSKQTALQSDLGRLASERETLAGEVEALRAKTNALTNPDRLRSAIEAVTEDNDSRLRLRSEIRRMVKRVELDFSGTLFPDLVVVTLVFVNDFRLGAFAIRP